MTDKTDSKERDLPGGWSLTDHGDEISLKGPDGERWRYRESIGTGTDGDFIYRFLRASIAAQALPEGITRDDTVHGETYFTAADMATAWSNGFKDGVASLAASAGSEPVAHGELFEYLRNELSAIPCRYRGDPSYDHDAYWMRDKVEKLFDEAEQIFTHPSPPEGAGWISVDERLPEPGMPVLLDIGKKYPIRAMWAAKHTVEASDECADDWAEYDEATDTYYCPPGWYEWNEHEETHWRVTGTPRGWLALPLPAPPASEAKEL